MSAQIAIAQMTTWSEADFSDLAGLMIQLSPRLSLTEERLRIVLEDNAIRLFVARDAGGRIVGCASLCLMDALSGKKGRVEDVVVCEEFRGRGLGRRLVEHVIAEARAMGQEELQLTSRPSRVAANGLYRSLGFEAVETNCYRMRILVDWAQNGPPARPAGF